MCFRTGRDTWIITFVRRTACKCILAGYTHLLPLKLNRKVSYSLHVSSDRKLYKKQYDLHLSGSDMSVTGGKKKQKKKHIHISDKILSLKDQQISFPICCCSIFEHYLMLSLNIFYKSNKLQKKQAQKCQKMVFWISQFEVKWFLGLEPLEWVVKWQPDRLLDNVYFLDK